MGATLEVLLGHMTFVVLLRRDVLCVPFTLNKFIRASYNDSARLWRSAREEGQAFLGLRFFKCHPDAPDAHTTFFGQHRLGFYSRCDLADLVESDDATAEMMLVPKDNFPEVPLEVVEASGWIDVASGRWRHQNENIIVLEIEL